jgi:hypothetical protein|tara:strand:- start:375 stop:665 length:291 start_codon:yes stop_codon:yes gene_type:complete
MSMPVFSQEIYEKISVELYPNPASEYINLKIDINFKLEDYDLSIHSLIGNQMNFNKEIISDNELRIFLDEFNNGYYFLILDNIILDKRKIIKFSKN